MSREGGRREGGRREGGRSDDVRNTSMGYLGEKLPTTGRGLSKKERGRFKKLRKRAMESRVGLSETGIGGKDAVEWRSLLKRSGYEKNLTAIGPAIRMRQGRGCVPVVAEGSNHRDLLFHILQLKLTSETSHNSHSGTSGPAGDKLMRLPQWACVHNMGLVDSVAFLEFHFQDAIPTDDLPFLSTLLQQQEQCNQMDDNEREAHSPPNYSILATNTKWFEGPNPQCISQICTVRHRAKRDANPRKRKHKGGDREGFVLSSSISSVLESMKRLSKEQMQNHGYPMWKETTTESSSLKSIGSWDVATPSLPSSMSPSQQVELPSLLHSQRLWQSHSVDAFVSGVPLMKSFVMCPISQDEKYQPKLFALDCEMVETSAGTELARVTLIQGIPPSSSLLSDATEKMNDSDRLSRKAFESPSCPFHYRVVMDELVRPEYSVTDYKTQYSGIMAADLESVETKLIQIQGAMVQLVHAQDVIVGHSLENDLKALRMVHEQVVDTAILFRSKRGGRKHSLRYLVSKLLGRTIQQSHKVQSRSQEKKTDPGHCSEEDAVASLELALHRALLGSAFRVHEAHENRISLLEELSKETKLKATGKDDNDKSNANPNSGPSRIVCVGPATWLRNHVTNVTSSAHALTCESFDDSNTKAVSSWLSSSRKDREPRFVWGKFMVPSQTLEFVNQADEVVKEVVENMRPRTLLLVAFQQGNIDEVLELAKLREARKNVKSSLGWSDDEEHAFMQRVERARMGKSFWIGGSNTVDSSGAK